MHVIIRRRLQVRVVMMLNHPWSVPRDLYRLGVAGKILLQYKHRINAPRHTVLESLLLP
jgi:hypothetical protein